MVKQTEVVASITEQTVKLGNVKMAKLFSFIKQKLRYAHRGGSGRLPGLKTKRQMRKIFSQGKT